MGRFILRYRGKGPKPADTADRIRALSGATVLDDGDRMMLVEAPEDGLRAALAPDEWLVSGERTYSMPDPRPRLKRPPRG